MAGSIKHRTSVSVSKLNFFLITISPPPPHVRHYAVPRFLGSWLGQPHSIPLLLAIPAVLLTLALYLKDPIEDALGLEPHVGENIVFAYSSLFPHWLLNSFFLFFTALVVTIGFLLLCVSEFRTLVRFGLLIGAGMMVSFLTSVTLLPAVVAATKPRFLWRGRSS